MRIGLPFSASDGPGRMTTWRDILGFARQAEALGLDSVRVCDHFLSGGSDMHPAAAAWRTGDARRPDDRLRAQLAALDRLGEAVRRRDGRAG
jgi:hypothetical protein